MPTNLLKFIPPRLLDGPVYETIMSLSRWLNLKLWSTSQVGFVGIPPSTEQGVTFLMQAGSTVITTDADGRAQINLPKTFPNGVMAAFVTMHSQPTAAAVTVEFIHFSWVKILTNMPSVQTGVSYMVVGW